MPCHLPSVTARIKKKKKVLALIHLSRGEYKKNWPHAFGHVALQCVCSGRQFYTANTKREKERKRGRKDKSSAEKRQRQLAKGAPECHLASNWGEKKGGGKRKKGSLEFTRGEFFLFADSWVSYYGIKFNQCPPPTPWNVEQRTGGNGWKSFWGVIWARSEAYRVGRGVGWGAVGWWCWDGSGKQCAGGLGKMPGLGGGGQSHSAGALMAPCQQRNYSIFRTAGTKRVVGHFSSSTGHHRLSPLTWNLPIVSSRCSCWRRDWSHQVIHQLEAQESTKINLICVWSPLLC